MKAEKRKCNKSALMKANVAAKAMAASKRGQWQ
jgi:hypothetical protein